MHAGQPERDLDAEALERGDDRRPRPVTSPVCALAAMSPDSCTRGAAHAATTPARTSGGATPVAPPVRFVVVVGYGPGPAIEITEETPAWSDGHSGAGDARNGVAPCSDVSPTLNEPFVSTRSIRVAFSDVEFESSSF